MANIPKLAQIQRFKPKIASFKPISHAYTINNEIDYDLA